MPQLRNASSRKCPTGLSRCIALHQVAAEGHSVGWRPQLLYSVTEELLPGTKAYSAVRLESSASSSPLNQQDPYLLLTVCSSDAGLRNRILTRQDLGHGKRARLTRCAPPRRWGSGTLAVFREPVRAQGDVGCFAEPDERSGAVRVWAAAADEEVRTRKLLNA